MRPIVVCGSKTVVLRKGQEPELEARKLGVVMMDRIKKEEKPDKTEMAWT